MAKSLTNLKRSHIVFLVVFILAAIGLKLWQYHWPEANVRLNGQHLHVLVAKTIYQQYRGLGGRDNLGKFDGMIFPFSEARPWGLVMRGMRFPIDIVWLNGGVIVDIAPNVPLEPGVAEKDLRVYYPRAAATMVLELPAGYAAAHGLLIGGTLKAAP